jgi:hypothetical protein
MSRVDFTNVLHAQIRKAQKDGQIVSVFLRFGICVRKSCTKNVGEINPSSLDKKFHEISLLYREL